METSETPGESGTDQARQPRLAVPRTERCPVCGETFRVTDPRHANKRLCGKEACKSRAKRLRKKQREAAARSEQAVRTRAEQDAWARAAKDAAAVRRMLDESEARAAAERDSRGELAERARSAARHTNALVRHGALVLGQGEEARRALTEHREGLALLASLAEGTSDEERETDEFEQRMDRLRAGMRQAWAQGNGRLARSLLGAIAQETDRFMRGHPEYWMCVRLAELRQAWSDGHPGETLESETPEMAAVREEAARRRRDLDAARSTQGADGGETGQ